MLRKAPNFMQKGFILGDISFLIGLEFEKGYDIRKAVSYFSKSLIPLHLRYRNDHFEAHDEQINIRKIGNFSNIKEATNFVDENIRPNITNELGLIAHNDSQIVLNLSFEFW